MTLITFEDGRPLKKEDGTIGTEQACCCCGGCIQIDYVYSIPEEAIGTAYTFSGSVKIRSVDGTPFGGEIQCFSDPDVVSVDLGIFSGRKMTLNYGDLLQSPFGPSKATLEFVCDVFSPRGAMFSNRGGGSGVDAIEFPNAICCGETIGTFSNPSEGDTLSATISRVGAGECNCEGFTLVEPS
jgi:hypothetical protein